MKIIEIQLALSRLGFDPGPADGDAGSRTIAAVKAFQKKYALKADGVAGDKTQAALRQALIGLSALARNPAAVATPSTTTIDARSAARLTGVHADLVRVVHAAFAANPSAFVVTEGLRTVERQRALLASGASTTMKSRHITGHAVDLAAKVGNEIRWDWPLYQNLALMMKAAAAAENVAIEWGGDWTRFKDGPHFQLPWNAYPA